MAILAEEVVRGREEFELDALFNGLVNFNFGGGHFIPGAAVADVDVLSAEADCGATAIHGGVSAAADSDTLAGKRLLVQTDFTGAQLLKEVDSADDALEFLSGNPHGQGGPGAYCQEDRVVVFLKPFQGNVSAELHVVFHFHAGLGDDVYF